MTTVTPADDRQESAPAGAGTVVSRALLVAAAAYIQRDSLDEAEQALTEMLALPDDAHRPGELAEATRLYDLLKGGALHRAIEQRQERERQRAIQRDLIAVVGACHGTTPKATRKHWLRVKVLELRREGLTRARICQELNATNWEISIAMRWLERNGKL